MERHRGTAQEILYLEPYFKCIGLKAWKQINLLVNADV